MAGYDRSTEHLTAVTDCRTLTSTSAGTAEFPESSREVRSSRAGDAGRRLAAFAAGAALVLAGVAGMHSLFRAGDQVGDWLVWLGALLLWLSALGGGVKLATWGAKPLIDAAFEAGNQRLPEPAQSTVAALGIIVGAVGLWWALRGGYTQWWESISGESGWSLALGAGQTLVAVLAGAALFTGGKYLAGLTGEVLADAGLMRTESPAAHRDPTTADKNAQSHPALLAALVAGGIALIIMAAWLTPKLAPTIMGANTFAAAAAIATVLVWGVGANLGWWKGLEGLYTWATAASEKTAAVTGVAAVLMFSASGLGLGWFTPATVPQAHAQCPPDCGGGSNGSNSYGPNASQFQPPQMPNQMPDYQGGNYGSNQAPLDQNSGISIYNTQAPSVSQSTGGQGAQQGPQQGWDQPAHGTQIPDYQNATPYTQGPGKPNPDFNGGQANPGSQGGQPNQGAQQPAQQPQQPAQNQPPQQDPSQQPNQSSDQQKIDDLTRQLQDQQQQSTQDRQRIDDMTKQLRQNKQNQKQQQLPKFPSKDKKKDDKDEQDDRDKQSGDNDLAALLMGAASTRRRKQDEQEQGPDTQALGQDASQAVQGLPGDVQTYVQSGQQIGESSGQAAQGFGSAAQAGASLASSAQSGAVNPQDAITLVQGVSQGIQGTADAVNAGSQIVKTAQGEADQVAQAVGDANPQLKPQTEQFTQLNDQASQVTDLVGQGAQLTSQGAGAVNSMSGMGAGGMPDASGAGDALSGTATAVDGPTDVPKPPTPPTPVSGGSGTGLRTLAGSPVDFKQAPPPPVPQPGQGDWSKLLDPSVGMDQNRLDYLRQNFFLDGVYPTDVGTGRNAVGSVITAHMSDGSTFEQWIADAVTMVPGSMGSQPVTLSPDQRISLARVKNSPLFGDAKLLQDGSVDPEQPWYLDLLDMLDLASWALLVIPGIDLIGAAGKIFTTVAKEFVAQAVKAMVKRGAKGAAVKAAAENAAKTAESVSTKLDKYLLNPDHPDGGPKAKWFKDALGFTRENGADLGKQIVFDESKAVQTGVTQYGTKFNQTIPITGANGKTIDVLFAFIRNNDGVVRLVTAIPTGK